MKVQEREKARELRKEGESVKEIARELNVSKGSVSLWVRDIQLTDGQKKKLSERMSIKGSYEARMAGSNANREKNRLLRSCWQKDGRKLARKCEHLHAAGCMLYWAEGRRLHNKNMVEISNSNPYLLRLFIRFLEKYHKVSKDDLSFSVNHYDDTVKVSDAEEYWANMLGLRISKKWAPTVNHYSSYSLKKKCGKLRYGTCRVYLGRTDILQKIYGAIQEYGKFDAPEWLG